MGLFSEIAGPVVGGLFAKREARKSRAFQERMSSTAHVREVADLRAAGLNPIISGMGGKGAATPGGAMAALPNFSATALVKAQTALLGAQTRSEGFKGDLSAIQAAIARGILDTGKGIGLGDLSSAKGVLGNIRDLNKGIGETTPEMQKIISKAKAKGNVKKKVPPRIYVKPKYR